MELQEANNGSSSVEVEFRVIGNAVCEIIWVKSLLTEMGLHLSSVPIVWTASTSATVLYENPIQHSKRKHVEIYLFFVRGKVKYGHVLVNFVPSSEHVVYILTKPLTEKMFVTCRKKLGIFFVAELDGSAFSLSAREVNDSRE